MSFFFLIKKQLRFNSLQTTCILSRISCTEGKVHISNNQSRGPFRNILFSCSMYLHLFKIAIYLWLGSIRGTTEFQFTFHCKIAQNYIFKLSSCRQIISIFCWRMKGSKCSLFNATVIWSYHATRSLLNGKRALCDETKKRLRSRDTKVSVVWRDIC